MEKERNCSFHLLSTIFSYQMLDFYVRTRIRFSLRDKRLFEITDVEITSVDCIFFLSSPLALKRDIAVTFLLTCMCVHCARSRASVRICPGHNSYIYARISNLFDTVVVLKEEKCYLKHFF